MHVANCAWLVVLLGCGPKPPVYSAFDQAVLGLTRIYQESVVIPMCDKRPSAPSTQSWAFGPISGRQRCGVLAWGFEPEGEWRELFYARLQERYWAADAAWIRNHCVGYPAECVTPLNVESLFLRDHNESRRAEHRANLDRLGRMR